MREKKTKKVTCMTLLCLIALRNKTVVHTNSLPSFYNANGRLCHEGMLRSSNFATMVTWRQTSPLYCGWCLVLSLYFSQVCSAVARLPWTQLRMERCIYRMILASYLLKWTVIASIGRLMMMMGPWRRTTSIKIALASVSVPKCRVLARGLMWPAVTNIQKVNSVILFFLDLAFKLWGFWWWCWRWWWWWWL